MELRVSNHLAISTPAPKPRDVPDSRHLTGIPAEDIVSANAPAPVSSNLRPAVQTRLVSELREDIQNGVRLIRTYEQADGRSFTRAEEILLTQNGARRGVVQQNPSGAVTRYEEVLDREEGGTFRRTQRFQDEAGEVSTQISNGYQVRDAFILTGAGTPAYPYNDNPFQPMRGTQLDLRA